jgi:hypothetical protein
MVSGNTNAGVPFSTVVQQSNMVMTGFYLGFDAAYGSAAALVNSWKSAASNNGITLRVVNDTPGFAPWTVGNGTSGWLSNALNASRMWAYTSASGSGGSDLAAFSGYAPAQGVLMLTPASSQTVPSFTANGKTGVNVGLNVWQVYAQYYYDVYIAGLASSKYGDAAAAANPNLDGFFLDNMTAGAQQVSSSATWNGAGTSPVGDTAATVAAIQQGDAKLVAAFKALDPNILLVANTGFASSLPAIDPSYQNLWPAILNEGAIGYSWSIETFNNSPPGAFMQSLIAAEATIAPGGTLILHQVGGPGGVNNLTGNQSSWTATQWQAVRMGFAAAMQRNWHYALNCGQDNYSSVGLMDEQVQAVNGTANYGWLSAGTQRLDPPQSAAWSNGVWRRRFPNGWVLWNPRGNGAQTVTIPSTLCRIKTRGYGDSTVNSGACGATTVTLQDADGLFLIGTG